MKSVVRHSDPSVFQGNTYNTHSNSYCIKLHINLYVMSYSSHMPMLTTMCFSSTLQLPRVDSYRYLQSGHHIPEGGHLSTPISLHRVLKFRTVVSTSTGLAYAAISLLGCVQLAFYLGGDSGWIAILIAGLLALLAAFCFSELNALYPTAAAIRLYMKEAFSDNFSLTITFGYLLTVVAAIAADSYIVGRAITYTFNLPDWAALIWILALLGLAMGANLLGIKIAGLLQDIATYSLLAFAMIISVIALGQHGFQLRTPFAAFGDPGNLLNAVAVGVFVFSAFEWVTPLSEEINDIRQIPRGMFVSLGLLFVSYALFTVACSSVLNVHNPAIANSPVPQMLLGKAALGQ